MRSIAHVLRRRPVKAETRSGVEKRFAPRRKGMTPALVVIDGTSVSIPCLIKDMSATGARLELRSGWDSSIEYPVKLHDRAQLVMRMDRVLYDCKIVRRGETELGVKFASGSKPLPVKAPAKSAVKTARKAQ